MLFKTDKCPCGSGILLKECCIPDLSPVSEKNQGYSHVNVNSGLVDNYGTRFSPIGMTTKIKIRKPQQISPQITNLLDSVRLRISEVSKYTEKLEEHIQNLDDNLHAVQYHKRQFLFRLKLLYTEEMLIYRPIKGNTIIELDDLPLRYEFEAFITRIIAALDVFAKLVGPIVGKSSPTNGNLFNYLKGNRRKKGVQEIYQVYSKNEEWILNLKELRNAVQHDGILPGFKSFVYDKGSVNYPKLNQLSTNHVCF